MKSLLSLSLAGVAALSFAVPAQARAICLRACPSAISAAAQLQQAAAPRVLPPVVQAVNLWLGVSVWLPGETAPFVLYGSTATGQVYYSAPAGFEVIVNRWMVGTAVVMQTDVLVSLSGLGQ